MGQHKFEKRIAKELRDREIKPQSGSWEQLSSRLEKEDKKSISLFFIAGIAASLTAAFLIFSLTFNNEPVQTAPRVVDTPSKVIEETGGEEQQELQQIAAEEIEVPEEPALKDEPVATKHQPSEIFHESVERSGKVETALVQESNAVPLIEEDITNTRLDLIEGEIVPARLEEVIAEVSARAGENEDLSESEIDALLYKAAAEISATRDRSRFTGKVDATALLMDVEMELDQTFREKVFDILKDGYLKARTAVANRNF